MKYTTRNNTNDIIIYDEIKYDGINLSDIYNFIASHNSLCYFKTSDICVNDHFIFDGSRILKFSDLIFAEKYKQFHRFSKDERSSFKYWFAHWSAFQLTALNMKCWKFKYLFHDFEKPWLKLFCNYKTVQTWHREHNSHHLEYGLKHGWDKCDWEAMVIDWECSKLTKLGAQLDARETLNYECKNKWIDYADDIIYRFEKILNKYNL
jgi:hypothetical protein